MLATNLLKLFNSTMPEFESEFDPTTLEETLNLLPDRCRGCKYAEWIIGVAWAFESSTGAVTPTLMSISELCSGHQGVETSDTKVVNARRGVISFVPGEDKGCGYKQLGHE